MNDERQNIELARHDERIKTVESFVLEMKENHLPHLYEAIARIDRKQAYYAGGIVGASAVVNWLISMI